MYKILFIICFIGSGCNQSTHNQNDDLISSIDTTASWHSEIIANAPDSSNPEIYDFMKIVIADQKLDLSYGLTIEPEPGCDLLSNDNEFLKTLLIERKNKNATDTFSLAENQRCLTANDIEAMLEQKQRLSSFKWDNRRLGFTPGNRDNWYCFSIPLFSKDRAKAVMMIRDLCKGLCGSGSTIVFTKSGGKWTSQNLGIWFH